MTLKLRQSVNSICEAAETVLCVGEVWETRKTPWNRTPCIQITFPEITTALLQELQPDIVLSALVEDDFDTADVAIRLETCGYQGRYRAVARALPEPALIRREVRLVAPALDYDIILLADNAARLN